MPVITGEALACTKAGVPRMEEVMFLLLVSLLDPIQLVVCLSEFVIAVLFKLFKLLKSFCLCVWYLQSKSPCL